MMRRLSLLLISLLALTVQAQNPVLTSIIMRHEGELSGANWSADGNRVLSWVEDYTGQSLRFWDLEAGTYTSVSKFWYNDVGLNNVIWSPDEEHYAVTLGNRSHTNPFYYQVGVDGYVLADANNHAAWNPDSRRLLTWLDASLSIENDSQALRVYDTETRELIGGLSHLQRIQEAVWSSDGESVLYLGYRFNDRFYPGQYFVGRWIPGEAEPVEEIALSEKDYYWVSWRPGDSLHDTLIMVYPMFGYEMPDCETAYCQLTVKFAGQDEFVDFTGDALRGLPMDVELSPSGNQLFAIHIDFEAENCRDSCTSASLWNREAPNEPIPVDIAVQVFTRKRIVWNPDESRFLVWYSDDELDTCENDICTTTLKLINSAGETELLIPLVSEFLAALQWNQAGDAFIYASNYDGDCEESCYAELQLVDAQTGESRLNLRYENQRIYQIEWREESNQLAVAVGRFIYIYDLANPENPLVLEGHNNISGGISFIWREDELLSWSADATLRYWDLSGETKPYEMGDWLYQIEEHPEEGYSLYRFHRNGVHSLELNADESRLLSWSWDDATLAVWDINGDTEPILLNHFPRTGYVRLEDAFWLDESHFLTDSIYGIQIWDSNPAADTYEPQEISYDEYRIQYRETGYLRDDNDYGTPGILRYYSLQEDVPELVIEHGGEGRVKGSFFEQHDWFISSGNESTKLWDIQDVSQPVLLVELRYTLPLGDYNQFLLSPDEDYVAWYDESLHVLALPSLEEVYTVELDDGYIFAEWDDAGERLFLGLNEQDCEQCRYELQVLYPFEERQPLVIAHERNIELFRYFASEDVLISAEEGADSFTSTIRIWDSQTGVELEQYAVDTEVMDIRWEYGKLLILPRDGNTIYIFNGLWGENPLILEHNRNVSVVIMSSDGRKLVVGTGSYMYSDAIAELRVWDLEYLGETARN